LKEYKTQEKRNKKRRSRRNHLTQKGSKGGTPRRGENPKIRCPLKKIKILEAITQ